MSPYPDKVQVKDKTRLEQELVASEAKYRQMVEQAWDGIVIHDHQAIYFANRCFRDMFGLSQDAELNGAHLHRFLAPDTRRALYESFEAAERSKDGPALFIGRGLRPDGTTFDLELSSFTTIYQDRPALQTVLRDITRRKQIEEQLVLSERLAAMGKLAFNIAHEINNPLGGIIAYTHLLVEDLSENQPISQISETADKILKLANRCRIIVGALLDFAREDREGQEQVDLNRIIEDTLALLAGHMIMNGLTIEKDLSKSLPSLLAHRIKMEQVFINLIINAAEAMSGQGCLTISTAFHRARREIQVRISDTGPGIPEDQKRLLFEPFFSTKPRGRGTGLGLSISHGIIKQHHGTIEMETQVGVGSTFIVTLPCHL